MATNAFNVSGQVNPSHLPGSYPGATNNYVSQTVGDAPKPDDWQAYFGPPPRPIETNPYDAYRQSTYQLPEAYKGYSPYLTTVIIRLILDEDQWPWREALPFVVDPTRLEITWDEIHFSNHMLNPVPEEGTSRLVSQTVSERRDHTVRYGLALQLEHGFMRTPKGQMCYTMNLKQVGTLRVPNWGPAAPKPPAFPGILPVFA